MITKRKRIASIFPIIPNFDVFTSSSFNSFIEFHPQTRILPVNRAQNTRIIKMTNTNKPKNKIKTTIPPTLSIFSLLVKYLMKSIKL